MVKGSQGHQGALERVAPDVAFRQQDYRSLECRGPQGKRLAPSTQEVCRARGPRQGPPPPAPPRTHQVDNGDAEQAAYSQDGQGQPQQRVRLHPLRDGTERRPGWAAPLWNHRVQSPGSSPRQGGAPAGGPGWGWGAHSPRAPQMGPLLPGSSTPLGSWRVLCPELRSRCSDKRDSPTLGATHSRSCLGNPGRHGKVEVSGEASGALSDGSPGRRGRGSDGQSSAGWVPGAGARGSYLHSPNPRWAPPTLTKN